MKALLIGGALVLSTVACASRGTQVALTPEQDSRCTAVSDSLSKYISQDALPLATLAGNASLRAPASVGPGDSVLVEILVRPDGSGDPSTVQVVGTSDPALMKTAVAFAGSSRFVPAQLEGCGVLSRYDVVLRR